MNKIWHIPLDVVFALNAATTLSSSRCTFLCQVKNETLMFKMFSRARKIGPNLGGLIREGCEKSKGKFKMAFAMKGGGLEGVSSATYLF